jgi:hypothetical protein
MQSKKGCDAMTQRPSIAALRIYFYFYLFRRRPPHLMFAHALEALAMTTEERMQERTKNK